MDVSFTAFEILTFKDKKWFVFPIPPLFDRRSPSEFFDEIYPAKKLVGWVYRMAKISQS